MPLNVCVLVFNGSLIGRVGLLSSLVLCDRWRSISWQMPLVSLFPVACPLSSASMEQKGNSLQ